MHDEDAATNPYASPGLPNSQAVETEPSAAASLGGQPFRDRSVGLIVFGVVEFLAGGLCALLVPLMIFALSMIPAGGRGPDVRTMLMVTIFYVVLAAILILIGVGSMQRQRWARALALACSWIWLVSGVMALVSYLAVTHGTYVQDNPRNAIPPEALPPPAVLFFAAAFLSCFYVVAPGILVLFYRSTHVKATCEAYHPEPSWTDNRPLPVLALSILLAFAALTTVCTMPYGCVVPLFGAFLHGFSGAVVLVLVATALAYLAGDVYRLNPRAWWATLGLYAILATSTMITFARAGLRQMYELMGTPAAQLEAMQRLGMFQSARWTLPIGLVFAAMLGYLFYVRRYFSPRAAKPDSVAQ